MINLYNIVGNSIILSTHDCTQKIDNDPIWIDLFNITPEEEKCVETYLEIDVPTREEMQEIEISSRLYTEDGALFMTGIIVAKSETTVPESHAVTFILYKNYLITVRYTHLHTFKTFSSHITKTPFKIRPTAHGLFTGLMDAITDRIADILETARNNIDSTAQITFHHDISKDFETKDVNYKEVLSKIGSNGRLISQSRESLVTLDRVITYSTQSDVTKFEDAMLVRLKTLLKDVTSLSDYAHFLSGETSFLLDATLGMINIEQNDIIKIFSIGSIIFLPPTLIASMYGMNFHVIPELSWALGYPYAIGLMALSALVPYKYFKRRKWF